jgi:hypothetical protein
MVLPNVFKIGLWCGYGAVMGRLGMGHTLVNKQQTTNNKQQTTTSTYVAINNSALSAL